MAQKQGSCTEAEVDAIIKKSYLVRVQDINASIDMVLEARALSKRVGYRRGEMHAEAHYAFYRMIVGDFKQSLATAKNLLKEFTESQDEVGLALVNFTIGSVHYKSDNFHLGLKYLLDCLELRRGLNDRSGQAQVLKAIGSIYDHLGDFESAEEVYLRCCKICKEIGDKQGESNACNPLSGIYLEKGNVTEALNMAARSMELKEEAGDQRGMGYAYYAKAKIYHYLQKYDLALKYYRNSLDAHKSMHETIGICMTKIKLGSFYYDLGDFGTARKELLDAIKIGESIHSKLILFKSYRGLYRVTKSLGETQEALDCLEKYIEYKETFNNIGTTSLIKSFKEMSRIKMLEREAELIRKKNAEIERKSDELNTFSYRVSHDLRGPVSSLMGLYNIARYDLKDPLSIKYIDMYHEQISRLNGIIVDLINLTRIKSWESNKEKIEFHQLIEGSINAFKYLPNFSEIKFVINIGKGIDYWADKSTISAIIQNLVENAIKYTPRKGSVPEIQVLVGLSEGQDRLLLQVTDNGIGIEDGVKDKIFDMFFRANDEKEGTGLGLHILKYAVDKLQGSVGLESKVGLGSTFFISLPYTQGQ